ncbi:hypothetical protein F8M41_018416 [Gigaspora margarita]|uniref:Uncharacterized protein n=1 Tax=Gigaspora margarita TaxID=4874 RepID=A0A8H4ALR1_GIGMA|nr:hypothetical protein F8M41_018416 [Gigaspora margarita]
MAKINATTISLDHNEIEATDNMSFELTEIELSNIMSFELIERETTDTMSFELTKKDVVNNPLDEITNIKTNEFVLQTSETAKACRNHLAKESYARKMSQENVYPVVENSESACEQERLMHNE